MSFGRDVERIAKNMQMRGVDVFRLTIVEVFAGTVRDTPIDTGRLRGNWQTTTITPANGTIDRFGDEGSIQEIESIVRGPDLYYLTNNLPYAERIEFDGWSKQAPTGMARKNARRVKAILSKWSQVNTLMGGS